LGCWSAVLSTRPRSSCWENHFGTSWWIISSRNLNRLMRSSYLNRTENILSPRPWTWIACQEYI
jgi:hypothetical protein